MKKNLLAYSIIFLSLFCFVDLSIGWSSFIFIALAVLLFFQQRGTGMPLPPVSLLLLANVLGYPAIVVVPWLYRDIWANMHPYIIELTMLWAVRGFAAFCCAYLLSDAFTQHFHRRAHRDGDEAERLAYLRYGAHFLGSLAIVAWVLGQYYFSMSMTAVSNGSASLAAPETQSSVLMVLQQMIDLRTPFLFLFGFMYIRRMADRFTWLLFAGVSAGLLFEIVTLGSKGVIIQPLVIAALVIACTARRLSLKQFCVGALMLVTVYMAFMIITEYRYILRNKNMSGEDVYTVSLRLETFGEAFFASLPFSEKSAQRRTTVNEEQIFNRISSGIFSFGNMLYFTGGHPPYENAWQTLLIPVYSIVPRAVMEKPIFLSAGRFGQEYFHTPTAISVSTLGAFYHAWGYGGILAGMALSGATVAFFIRRTLLRATAFNSMVLMASMVLNLVNVGSSFFQVINESCRLAVILLGLYMLYPIVRRLKNGYAVMALPAGRRTGGDL